MNDEQMYLRQSVGKIEFLPSLVTYKEWRMVDTYLKYDKTSVGCSHGNGAMPPPVWSNYSGPIIFFTYFDYVNLTDWSEDVPLSFLHSVNFYIGRLEETGEPWLAPGNFVQVRLQERYTEEITFTTTVVKAPPYHEDNAEIIGPFHVNFEDILHNVRISNPYAKLIITLTIDGPNEEQEDLHVLGGDSGFWAIEAVPPLFRWPRRGSLPSPNG